MGSNCAEIGGITFTGAITVNGPMFDIHDNQNVFISSGKDKKASQEAKTERALEQADERLETAEAEKYWRALQLKGFVDEDCQLMPETTRKQAMYIAELFAERLGMKSKWKPFQSLWNLDNLAQEKWNMQQTGCMPSRYKEIEKVFEG